MRTSISTDQSWNGRHLTITFVTPNKRDARIHDAIAKKAFRIWESRGFVLGHQLEDWRRAESETLRPLTCGFLVLDDKIELNTDPALFDEGEITVWVEPLRLTICGKERVCKPGDTLVKGGSGLNGDLIFRFLDIPFEIEPFCATARFKGRALEIDLPKAGAMRKVASQKKAA